MKNRILLSLAIPVFLLLVPPAHSETLKLSGADAGKGRKTVSDLTVYAGADQQVQIPVQRITLSGQIHTTGRITSTEWTGISSGGATIVSPSSAKTEVHDLIPGDHTFVLTATDNLGATKSDTVVIVVQPPSLPAKKNRTIVVLGSSTAAGYGLSHGASWADQLGVYIQELYSDSRVINLSKSSAPTYTMMPTGFRPPQGRALPDTNANITKALWLKPDAIILNFPSNDAGLNYSVEEQQYNFRTAKALADSANIPLWVTTTQPRTWFSQAQRDNLAVMRDWLHAYFPNNILDFWSVFATAEGRVDQAFDQGDGTHLNALAHKKLFARVVNSGILRAVGNDRPQANAGPDQSVTLPTSSVTVSGAGTDVDGSVTGYYWDRISGSGNIASANTASTNITGLAAGKSVFRLTVTDNEGGKGHSFMTVWVNKTTPPVARAGTDLTISALSGRAVLDASGSSGNGLSYEWRISEGSGTLLRPASAVTSIQNVTSDTKVQLKVTDRDGAVAFDDITINIIREGTDDKAGFNAHTFVPRAADTMLFQYGSNLGYYGNGWSDTMLARLIKDVNGMTTRSGMADWLVTQYGINTREKEYRHITGVIGLKDLTVFIGEPHDSHRDSTIFHPSFGMSKVFANLYTPIWKQDGTVNANNYFAKYVEDVVMKYSKIADVRFWEIVNEPDFTYYFGNSYKTDVHSWWYSAPEINNLVNLGAPVYYYVRMLRIAYEVIKKHQPDAYVTPGGIGYEAFLDVMLRYTDNPDGGKVSAEYPLTGGAYFDCLSFHSYPQNYLSSWSNEINGFRYYRHSDAAVEAMFDQNGLQKFKDVFTKHGYDGSTYPQKTFILTEYNIPRKMFETRYGGDEAQRNYIIKALVKTQKYGIVQSHIYDLGEHANHSTNFEYDLMGLYENLTRDKPGSQKLTMEGRAFKTTAKLLYGWRYDAAQTAALKLPDNLDGAAFKQGDKYRFVLWAKTTTDMSEHASGTFHFPEGMGIGALVRYEWDFADNTTSKTIAATGISLSGTPSFFEATSSVPPANQPPVANAGKDATITLPTNSANLSGSGTDADGSITSYKWTKKSGPSSYNIVNPNSAVTNVTGLTEGVYQFELTVTDDKGATASATTKVTVNAAPNQPPVANAGKDATITLPTNSANLSGSGTDADGSITSYKWTKKSGPSSYNIVNPSSAVTNVTGLTEGVYQFELTVTDDKGATASATMKVTVNAAPNQPPVANAGKDATITLPTNSANLSGSGTDADGSITSYKWTKKSGPSSYNIVNPNSAVTNVTGLTEGVYQFELTVTDDKGATASATMKVTVNAAPNQPPVANAGKDATITLPTNSANLSGSGTDADGSITSYKWTKKSGPSSYNIVNPNSAVTNVTGLTEGVYQFELTVTDDKGATASATMKVTVNAAPNQPPVANAGKDATITLPTNSANLSGSGTDADGSITSYKWTKKSGPSSYNIVNPNSAVTNVTGLTEGVYQFELTVTDDKGATASATMKVTVNAAPNQPPVASAGKDVTITLPTSSVQLSGSGSDPDGRIVSYQWIKSSGPSAYQFSHPTQASTQVTGLTAGVYVFQLKVTDDRGATATASVKVTVIAANIPPKADAGGNLTVTLPDNRAQLKGSGIAGTEPVTAYRWHQVNGPSQAVINNPSSATTEVEDLMGGNYIFVLTVTDQAGVSASDTMMLTVTLPRLASFSSGVRVYPNPTAGVAILEVIGAEEEEQLVMIVSEVSGKVIWKETFTTFGQKVYNKKMDLTALPNGIYLVSLRRTDGKVLTTRKIVKG